MQTRNNIFFTICVCVKQIKNEQTKFNFLYMKGMDFTLTCLPGTPMVAINILMRKEVGLFSRDANRSFWISNDDLQWNFRIQFVFLPHHIFSACERKIEKTIGAAVGFDTGGWLVKFEWWILLWLPTMPLSCKQVSNQLESCWQCYKHNLQHHLLEGM